MMRFWDNSLYAAEYSRVLQTETGCCIFSNISLCMDSCAISKLMTQQPSETQPYPATSRNPSCGVRLYFT